VEHIKVNLPRDKEAYLLGNGEGIWVKVEPLVKKAHDRDDIDAVYSGILANDSVYYPSLKIGNKVVFELRGNNRPVALWDGFLADLTGVSDKELEAIKRKVIAHREQYIP
jgi:hypothetical protein